MRLGEMALAYVARFSTSAARLERYLRRKLRERGWDGEGEPQVAALVERYVDLGYVDMPVLNVFAEHDHLVPPSSSKALGGLVGSTDYSELSFRGGHIGIYVSGRAQREVPQAVHDWLAERSR